MKNKVGRLMHFEDSILYGVEVAGDALDAVQGLSGWKTNISVKWDGSPCLVFGVNPDTKKFFLTTKNGYHAKQQRIAYSSADTIELFGYELGLKMSNAFEALEPTMKWGSYQTADLLYSSIEEVSITSEGLSFTPNILTYTAPFGSKLVDMVGASKVGIALHGSSGFGDQLYNSGLAAFSIDTQDRWNIPQRLSYMITSCRKFLEEIQHLPLRTSRALPILQFNADLTREGEFYQEHVPYHRFLKYVELFDKDKWPRDSYDHYYENEPFYSKVFNVIRRMNILKLSLMKLISPDSRMMVSFDGEPAAHEGYVLSTRLGNGERSSWKLVNRNDFTRRLLNEYGE